MKNKPSRTRKCGEKRQLVNDFYLKQLAKGTAAAIRSRGGGAEAQGRTVRFYRYRRYADNWSIAGIWGFNL